MYYIFRIYARTELKLAKNFAELIGNYEHRLCCYQKPQAALFENRKAQTILFMGDVVSVAKTSCTKILTVFVKPYIYLLTLEEVIPP